MKNDLVSEGCVCKCILEGCFQRDRSSLHRFTRGKNTMLFSPPTISEVIDLQDVQLVLDYEVPKIMADIRFRGTSFMVLSYLTDEIREMVKGLADCLEAAKQEVALCLEKMIKGGK